MEAGCCRRSDSDMAGEENYMRMTASTWERIVSSECEYQFPFGKGGKYKRWFWATRSGDVWLMDTEFYDSKDYSGTAVCVVYARAMFPKFDKETGDIIPESISYFEWAGPGMNKSILKKYHAEKVDIIPDEVV
jgi:hypothetical protein